MQASPGAAGPPAEDLLGELALTLAPRLEHAPDPHETRAVLGLNPAALSAAELGLLTSAPGAECLPARAPRMRLRIGRAALGALVPRSDAARVLRAAFDAGTAPRRPARLMGILNVTPDSFSDGAAFLDPARAIAHGRAMVAQGAELIDVGGESTRPGAGRVPAEVQIERVLPVIAALASEGVTLSIDTTRAEVAAQALDAGARIVNDVSAGLDDPALLALVAERGAGLILMHMRGTPRDMQVAPHYVDVVGEVAEHLRARARAAWQAGVDPARILIDPGIGFGKDLQHNLALIAAVGELRSLGFALCMGVSRKSFLARLGGAQEPGQRRDETTAAVTLCALNGAEVHRVHEIAPARAALRVAAALEGARRP